MTRSDPEEGFRVTDRRRQGDAAESPASGPRRVEHPEPRNVTAPRGSSAGETERTLTGLFMMLASSAVVAMGEAPDPVSGQRHRDPGQAAELIDLLMLLRERTEGNRIPKETQILDELIYDLQVRYVNAKAQRG